MFRRGWGGGKKGPLGVEMGPIRKFLADRETLIPDRPKIFKDPPEIALPPGVTEEQAVKVVAESPWARGWGEGIAKLAGYKESTPAYHRQVKRLSEFVAKRMLGV